MPKMGVANNLSLNPIPKDQELTIMEGLTIAKLIIFQMIRLTPKSRWRRLQDRLISVPVMEEDVINTISQLPRTPQEAGLVAVTFKRKLEYKTSHIKETLINPHKIYKVLSELVNNGNPYYREFQEYQAFKERCIQEDEDGVRLVFPKEEEIEDILNISDLSIEDDVLPDLADLSVDQDQREFEEEEYRTKDSVKKFQLEGHDRSSCLNNKFPEETFEDTTLTDRIQIAPAENKIPINLLAHHDWDIQAFPHLHNYDGSNGLHQKRDVKLTLQEYFQQRILNHDPRFRENHMYLYAAVGAVEKNQIQRNINLSYSRGKVQEGEGSVTMKLDDPYVCLEDIKNSPRYWKKKKYVMNAKLENLGAFNVFFTLSCADGRWPEVVGGILAEKGYEIEVRTELCRDGYEVNQVFVRSSDGDMLPLDDFLEKESPDSRHELLRGSVLQATRYFNERVRKFVSKIVMDKRNPLSVKYYDYKVEFQQRGAPHIHGVLWLDLEKLEKMNENLVESGEDEPKIFPNLKSAFRKLKADEELTDDDLGSLQNLVDTFSTVCIDPNVVGAETARIARQVNTHSHTYTCTKKERENCRFHFPRFPSQRTIIRRPWRLNKDTEERKKELKLILKRVQDVLQNEEVIKELKESCKDEEDYERRLSQGIDLLLKAANVSQNDYYEALSYGAGYGVIHKRGLEEIFVNPYNIDWLRAWDANIDFSFAFDFHAQGCIFFVIPIYSYL